MRIKASGGVVALLTQMRRSRNDVILTQSASAMRCLCTVYARNLGLQGWGVGGLFDGAADAYDVFSGVMTRTQCAAVHVEVSGLLLQCVLVPSELPRVVQGGVVEVALRQCAGKRDPAVVVNILDTLCVLVASTDHRDMLLCCGGIDAAVSVLNCGIVQKEWDDARASAANVLAILMTGSGKEMYDWQTRVGSAGGSVALLKVCGKATELPAEQWHMWLVEQTSGALCNVSFENDAERVKLGDLGACELFTRICQQCDPASSRHKRVLEQACAALGNISKKNRTNRMKIGQCGGPEALVHVLSRTLQAGPDGDRIAMQAMRAVGNVLMRNEENQERFAEAGGCKNLVQYCFATRNDTMLRWLVTALTPLAEHELIR